MPDGNGESTGNGLLEKTDAALIALLIGKEQKRGVGGISALLRIVKDGKINYLPFGERSATERLDEAAEEIMRKNPDSPRFVLQPPKPAEQYEPIYTILRERLAKGTIEGLVVLYVPGMTQSLKVRKP